MVTSPKLFRFSVLLAEGSGSHLSCIYTKIQLSLKTLLPLIHLLYDLGVAYDVLPWISTGKKHYYGQKNYHKFIQTWCTYHKSELFLTK